MYQEPAWVRVNTCSAPQSISNPAGNCRVIPGVLSVVPSPDPGWVGSTLLHIVAAQLLVYTQWSQTNPSDSDTRDIEFNKSDPES